MSVGSRSDGNTVKPALITTCRKLFVRCLLTSAADTGSLGRSSTILKEIHSASSCSAMTKSGISAHSSEILALTVVLPTARCPRPGLRRTWPRTCNALASPDSCFPGTACHGSIGLSVSGSVWRSAGCPLVGELSGLSGVRQWSSKCV